MYDRAPRPLTQPSGSTAAGVGPGTYRNEEKRSTTESYAPFQSMSARESFLTVTTQLAAAPGPGQYSLSSSFQRASGRGCLHNKAERFTPPSSTAPGPGAYTVSRSSDWIRKTYPPPPGQRRDPAKSRVAYYRQGTAPSIPMPGQSYGYEESEGGVLQPQVLPPRDSSMGPAYYNVSYEDTLTSRKYKGVHFGTLRSLRTQFRGREGPGPGDYAPQGEEEGLVKTLGGSGGPRSKGRSTDNLPRYHELITRIEEKKAVPGPGKYEIRSQFSPAGVQDEGEEPPEGPRAPFGSTQQRFLTLKHASPACTTYEDPRTALGSLQRLNGMKKTPFGQTSARFKTDRHAREVPGPGSYDDSEATSMATGLTKKALVLGIHKHPFGTTSVRTAPIIKKDEHYLPGPAHYQQQPEKEGKGASGAGGKGQKLSHTFASTSKRLYSPPSIVTDIPPPGSYEISEAFSKSQDKAEMVRGAVKGAFLSSSRRFAPPRDILLEEPDAFNPGPCEYDPDFSAIRQQEKLGLLCCRDDRFKPLKSSVPGPGAYQLSKPLRDTLLQGTFNVSLNNPLGSDQSSLEATAKKQTFVLGV